MVLRAVVATLIFTIIHLESLDDLKLEKKGTESTLFTI